MRVPLAIVNDELDAALARELSAWSLHEAALHGSSHYDLPIVMRWFTANIGVHHVHHLCSRVPFYRLPRILRDHPEFRSAGRLTLVQSFACVRLALWDETRQRLVSFQDCALPGPRATQTADHQASAWTADGGASR